MKISRAIYLILIICMILPVVVAVPTPPYNVSINSTSRTPTSALSNALIAGNVSSLNLYTITVTNTWTGVYGNVSGVIHLEDQAGSIFYKWSLSRPAGEIYAATSEINFDAIINAEGDWHGFSPGCWPTNISGNNADGYFGAGDQRWGTGFYGLHELENTLGLNTNFEPGLEEDPDGVNETFTIGNDYNSFYVGTLKIDNGAGKACPNVNTFSQNQTDSAKSFDEVLLYDNSTHLVVYVAILNRTAPIGFDYGRHQFQMLLGENGHADTSTTDYYFYVELE